MQTQNPSPLLSALRRALAACEFAAAGLLLLLALDGFMTNRAGGGCAAFGAAMAQALALPGLLVGSGLALVAYKGWRSGRRWWARRGAMLAWPVAAPVLSLVLSGAFGGRPGAATKFESGDKVLDSTPPPAYNRAHSAEG